MMPKALKEAAPYLRERWGEDLCRDVMSSAEACFRELRKENSGDRRAVRKHTEKDIFPCIALFRSLQDSGVDHDTALEFADRLWSLRAEKGAARMKGVLRHLGLYRRYPSMFMKVAKSSFGPSAGFEARFYDCGKNRCRFDMTRCLFLDTCTRYGCPELTVCFCHVDDVNNRDLHPGLCWGRTRYMGRGDDLCDFDIYVKEER